MGEERPHRQVKTKVPVEDIEKEIAEAVNWATSQPEPDPKEMLGKVFV